MPQFGFYTVPANAKSMTFSSLFVDCVRQMGAKDPSRTPPLNISNQLNGELGVPYVASDIPEPYFLSDFASLFRGTGVNVLPVPPASWAKGATSMILPYKTLPRFTEVSGYEVSVE